MGSVTPPNMAQSVKEKVLDVTAGTPSASLKNSHRLIAQSGHDVRAPQNLEPQSLNQGRSRRHIHVFTSAVFRPWERLSAGQTHILNQQSLALGVPGVDIKQSEIKSSSSGNTWAKVPAKRRASLKRRQAKKIHQFRQSENIAELVEMLFKTWRHKS